MTSFTAPEKLASNRLDTFRSWIPDGPRFCPRTGVHVAKKTLVINGDREHFSLVVDAGTLHVGDRPNHVEGTLQGLRIVRIHCEVEVEEERESVPIDQEGVLAPRILRSDAPVQLTHAHLSFASGDVSQDTVEIQLPRVSTPEPTAVPLSTPTSSGPKRLRVTDGGDQGQSFPLPETGTLTIGKTGGSATIGLHDLYVSKLHCTLQIVDGAVTVSHSEGQNGTLIDGQRLVRPKILKPGSVLRVGNSHLLLEVGPFFDGPALSTDEETKKGEGSKVMRAHTVTAEVPPPRKSTDPFVSLEGKLIGQHQLVQMIGRGHAGAVFKATNIKSGQTVAVKVFDAQFPASPAELEHFVQELRVIQPIRHPNILAMLGAGKSATNFWIAHEFVEGESAAAVIGRIASGEKSSWSRSARVAIHLARALECLEQHRYVHKNITPRNVLLQSDGYIVKLADLGISQALEGSQLRKAIENKELLEDLPYQAPEQMDPDGFVDSLADLYAVGAVVYALVAGRPPVTGDSAAEVLEQIKAGRVSRPSMFYKKVPAAFDAIVMKLLARNQEDRYQTATSLLEDLEPLSHIHNLKV